MSEVVVGTLNDGAHFGGGQNGQDAYTGRIQPCCSHGINEDVSFTLNALDQHAIALPSMVAEGDAHTGFRDEHGLVTTIAWDEELNASVEQSGTMVRGGDGGRHAGVMVHENIGSHVSEADHARDLRGGASHNYQFAKRGMQVRRLTPLECERLQGLPDGYTAITYRGKPAADGPRYKAIGNGWAIPDVRWIGQRLEQVDRLFRAAAGYPVGQDT